MLNDKSNKPSNLNSTEKVELELDDFLEAISAPDVINSLAFEIEQNLSLINSPVQNKEVEMEMETEIKHKSKKTTKTKKTSRPKKSKDKSSQNYLSDTQHTIPSKAASNTMRVSVNKKVFTLIKLVYPSSNNNQVILGTILLDYLKCKHPEIEQFIPDL